MNLKSYVRFILVFATFGIVLIQIGCDKTEENKPPSCTIIYPNNGDEIEHGDTVSISVDADDSDGHIIEVRFYVDEAGVSSSSNFPYNFIYYPQVLIYEFNGSWHMKVEDVDETISVVKLK